MGTWAVSGYKQVATFHLHLVKRKRGEKNQADKESWCLTCKAIRIAFLYSMNSWGEAVQEDGDVAMSRGKAVPSARKAEAINRGCQAAPPSDAGAGTFSVGQD